MAENIATVTDGAMGAGKSLARGVIFLVEEFLPECEGKFITNIPLDIDACAAFAAKGDAEKEEKYRERIVLIPDGVWAHWCDEETSGEEMVAWFRGQDLAGAYIVLDEAHQILGDTADKNYVVVPIRNFIQTLRHDYAKIELITQSWDSVSKVLQKIIQRRYSVVPNDNYKIPYIGIRIKHGYELLAGIGKLLRGDKGWGYLSFSKVLEFTREGRRWRLEETKPVPRNPAYFELYDSHGATKKDGKAKPPPLFEYQKRSFPGLLLWIVRMNFFQLAFFGTALSLLVWLVPLGGFSAVFERMQETFRAGLARSFKMGAKADADDPGDGQPPVEGMEGMTAEKMASELAVARKYNEDLIRKIQESETRKQAAEEKLRKLAMEERYRSGIAMIEERGVIDRGGMRIFVGETFGKGLYAGKTLDSVSPDLRSCVVGGDVVRLVRVREGEAAGSGGEGGEMDGPLPDTGIAGGGQADSAGPSGEIALPGR